METLQRSIKKFVSLALIFALLCAAGAARAEESRFAGNWYSAASGLPVQITLNPDGTYTVQAPFLAAEAAPGQWTAENETLILDGVQTLAFNGQALVGENGFTLYPEEQAAFSPAPDAEAELAAFAGEWECQYVAFRDVTLPAESLCIQLKIWIDGTLVSLGGFGLFSGSVNDYQYDHGILSLSQGEEAQSVSLELQMLEDGSLRFSLASPDDAITFYLHRAAKIVEEEP